MHRCSRLVSALSASCTRFWLHACYLRLWVRLPALLARCDLCTAVQRYSGATAATAGAVRTEHLPAQSSRESALQIMHWMLRNAKLLRPLCRRCSLAFVSPHCNVRDRSVSKKQRCRTGRSVDADVVAHASSECIQVYDLTHREGWRQRICTVPGEAQVTAPVLMMITSCTGSTTARLHWNAVLSLYVCNVSSIARYQHVFTTLSRARGDLYRLPRVLPACSEGVAG